MRTREHLSNQRIIYSYTGGRHISQLHVEKGAKEGINRRIWVVGVVITLFVSFIPIIIEIVPTVEAPAILEVDDSGGKPYTSIQAAVDDAQPGDTVLVYAGIYYEDVVIDKTINLTGEDRDTTIINSTSLMGIYVTNADYVNITGFTVVNGSWAGIRLMPSNNSLIENNRVECNNKGIQIIDSNNTIVKNNIASNNTNDYGIYSARSTNITVINNTCFGNQGKGIYIFDNSNKNFIIGNNCSGNADGIRFGSTSFNNYIYTACCSCKMQNRYLTAVLHNYFCFLIRT